MWEAGHLEINYSCLQLASHTLIPLRKRENRRGSWVDQPDIPYNSNCQDMRTQHYGSSCRTLILCCFFPPQTFLPKCIWLASVAKSSSSFQRTIPRSPPTAEPITLATSLNPTPPADKRPRPNGCFYVNRRYCVNGHFSVGFKGSHLKLVKHKELEGGTTRLAESLQTLF